MSTTNLKIENIFADYELVDTVATKATLDDALQLASVADDDEVYVQGTGLEANILIYDNGATPSPAATEISIVNPDSGDPAVATLVRKAINGTEDANVSYGSSLDSSQGVDGVKATAGTATSQVDLEAEDAGANTISARNGAAGNISTGGVVEATGVAATGAVNIPLSNLDISGNSLTVEEAQDETGDYRKLLFHYIRAHHTYLQTLESVASITIGAGGSDYVNGEALVFSGGSPTVAASGTITVTGGAISGFVLAGGSGYNTAPVVTVTSAAGVDASLTGVLSTNTPAKLTVAKGALVENSTTGIISRAYTVTFGLDESGLDLATD